MVLLPTLAPGFACALARNRLWGNGNRAFPARSGAEFSVTVAPFQIFANGSELSVGGRQNVCRGAWPGV